MLQQHGGGSSSGTVVSAGGDLAQTQEQQEQQQEQQQQQLRSAEAAALRAEQDQQFAASLEADRARAQARELQELLLLLKASCCNAARPAGGACTTATAAAGTSGNTSVVTSGAALVEQQSPPPLSLQSQQSPPPLSLRLRLPDGSAAQLVCDGSQSLTGVFEFVFAQPGMPLWNPGSWALACAFPSVRVAPPQGLWALSATSGVTSVLAAVREHLTNQPGDVIAGGRWPLQVRRLRDPPLTVLVQDSSSVAEVKEQLEQQTGAC